MSASPARIQANRRNAESSTGPRTGAEEDLKTYQDFRDRFFADLQPKGFLEEQLALTLVNTQWRPNRCRAFEQSILTHQPGAASLPREQQEEYAMKDAAKVLKLCRAKQMPFDSAASGFVFSNADVETWLRRHEQIEEARQADMIEFNQRFFGPLNKPNSTSWRVPSPSALISVNLRPNFLPVDQAH